MLPCIDISNPQQIHNWVELKLALLDIGRKYFLRMKIFTSFMFFFSFVAWFFILLDIFNITRETDKKLLVLLVAFDAVVSLVFMIYMLEFAKKINNFY